MDNLSKEQYKLLKKIDKFQKISDTDINYSDREIMFSLISIGLVEINWLFDAKPFIDNKLPFPNNAFPPEYKITQTGKAYIQSNKSSIIKWWTLFFTSLLSIAVTIIIAIIK